MNNTQRRFFEHLASIQESCVQSCMIQHGRSDDASASMLYDITYEVITEIMEMLDGYSGFSHDRHDIINTATGERLNLNPTMELHDQTEGFLRTE